MSLKRITAFVLCFILAMALIAPASADDAIIDYSSPVYREIPISYDEPETFSFSISPNFKLTKDSEGNLNGLYPVSLSARLQPGSEISVSVEGDCDSVNGITGRRWRLTGSSSNIYYMLTSRNPDSSTDVASVTNGTTIMRYNSDTANTVTRNLEFMASAQENPNIKPGNYQGTLTFVIRKTSLTG